MEVEKILYTPDWHERLLNFMIKMYPARNKSYLTWWLTNLDNGERDNWERTIILVSHGQIVGCTTAFGAKMLENGKKISIFWEGNTIISNAFRGKGLSRILYGELNLFTNRFTTGFTDIAWKIQPKFMDVFIKLSPVRIYISLNRFVVSALLKKIGIANSCLVENYPDSFHLRKNERLRRIKDFENVAVPEEGAWMNEKAELIRDKEYLKKRFTDIYRAEEYRIYLYEVNEELEGYLVVRKTHIAGIDMLSLVDFRCKCLKSERRIMLAAVKLARWNKIGVIITLTSRDYPLISFRVLRIKMKKKLYTASGDPKMKENTSILITSADSDLDFVYYK